MSKVYSPLLGELVRALQVLPGVGAKSAQRMAFHLLKEDRTAARWLAESIGHAAGGIRHCSRCRMLTEEGVCSICSSHGRDAATLCVVETPADLLAIEQSGAYNGRYFVLMGHLSPIDGVGPAELGLDLLADILAENEIREVVVATGVTVEGDATAHLVSGLAHQCGITASRIAYGVPVGGELEFIDGGTLARALSGRRVVETASGDEREP